MTRHIILLLSLLLSLNHTSVLYDNQSCILRTKPKAVTIDEAKEYFLQYIQDDMMISIGDPEEYYLSMNIGLDLDKRYNYVGTFIYFDHMSSSRCKIIARISVDLVSIIDEINETTIEIITNRAEPYTKELWEKELKTLHALQDWYDATKTAPLWDYKEKYEFYQREGDFPGSDGTYFRLYDYRSIGIDKPTGSMMILPQDGDMQYDEALEKAWSLFKKYEDYSGNLQEIAISSACIKLTKESIEQAKETYPDFPDDGVQWIFRFYVPVSFDNGETLYKSIFYSGVIMKTLPVI